MQDRCIHIVVGGTGNLPVPSGYQPDGTVADQSPGRIARNYPRPFTQQVAARGGLVARSTQLEPPRGGRFVVIRNEQSIGFLLS